MSTGRNGVLVLNDQGGSVMNVSEDITGTLRAEMNGHPPVVLQAAGFMSRAGVESDIAYHEETAPSLRATMIPEVVIQSAAFLGGNSETARSIGYEEEMSPTVKTNPPPMY